jgi:hypothetical protein
VDALPLQPISRADVIRISPIARVRFPRRLGDGARPQRELIVGKHPTPLWCMAEGVNRIRQKLRCGSVIGEMAECKASQISQCDGILVSTGGNCKWIIMGTYLRRLLFSSRSALSELTACLCVQAVAIHTSAKPNGLNLARRTIAYSATRTVSPEGEPPTPTASGKPKHWSFNQRAYHSLKSRAG